MKKLAPIAILLAITFAVLGYRPESESEGVQTIATPKAPPASEPGTMNERKPVEYPHLDPMPPKPKWARANCWACKGCGWLIAESMDVGVWKWEWSPCDACLGPTVEERIEQLRTATSAQVEGGCPTGTCSAPQGDCADGSCGTSSGGQRRIPFLWRLRRR